MSNATAGDHSEKRYKGVRRRKWGKWVSEIRVPGTGDRLWLGSYTTPEAAAAAHDTALFFFRGPSSSFLDRRLNFPDQVAEHTWVQLSPLSVQRAASNRGMMVDAQLAIGLPRQSPSPESNERDDRRRASSGETATSEEGMSPLSVQRATSNRGMMVDAQLAIGGPRQSPSPESNEREDRRRASSGETATSEETAMIEELNVNDMEIINYLLS